MLADYLRRRKSMPGTKVVCAEGDCGACTVLKAPPFESASGKKRSYLPVNSCIIPVASLDGASLVTIDGLADRSAPHPVQESMVKCHGSQCGFCTPGFVMALAGLVEKRIESGEIQKSIEAREAKNALTANLCRCTGYQPIIDAACSIPLNRCKSVRERHESKGTGSALGAAVKTSLLLKADEFEFFAPKTLDEAGRYLKKNADAKLMSGATDLGVLHNKRKQLLSKVLSLHLIPELYRIKKSGRAKVHVGARVTLSVVRDFVKAGLIPELAGFLDLFASPQIKNQATLVGNLANASPIGDTPPFLLVAGTVVHTFNGRVTGARRRRKIPIEEFFLGYRKTALVPGEFITAVEFEVPAAGEILSLRKVSQRKDLDISTVNAAFRLQWDSKKQRIKKIRVAYGGVAATPVRLSKLERLMEGAMPAHLDSGALVEALHAEITPLSDVRSSSAFRRVAAENLLLSFLKGLSAQSEVQS